MRVLTVLASLVIPVVVLLSEVRGQAVAPVPAPAAAKTALSGRNGPLSLMEVDVQVDIDGLIARTMLTVTVHNEATVRNEGTLLFDVPSGATVNAYSLIVNSAMVEGVAVERERARQSYIQEVTRRVDPGLVEHVSGTTFCTRVFPIEIVDSRTFSVGYVSELTVDKGRATYTAPLNWGEIARVVRVKVDVAGSSAGPIVSGDLFKSLAFEQKEGRFSAAQSFHPQSLKGNFTLSFAAPAAAVVAVGKGPEIIPAEGPVPSAAETPAAISPGYYFSITDFPLVHPAPLPVVARPAHHIGVLWDAGIRLDFSDPSHKISLLEKILKQLRNVDVDLIVFRETSEKPAAFAIRDGNTAAISRALSGLIYDGASRLSTLSFPKHVADLPGAAKDAKGEDFDYWLLFSDGMSRIAAIEPGAAQTPVFMVCAGSGSGNAGRSDPLCIASGGAVLDLAAISDERAMDIIEHGELELADVEFNGKEVADVTPRMAGLRGGVVSIAGRLLVPQANVTLRYRCGSVISTRTFIVRQADAKQSNAVACVWMNHRLEDLSGGAAADDQECLRIGRLFNAVTRASSLLVLETVDQYVRHRVRPPVSLPEFCRQYDQAVRFRGTLPDGLTLQQELAAAWNERVAWYQTRFEPNVAIQNARLARANSHLAKDGRIASRDGDISNFLDALEDSQQASAERQRQRYNVGQQQPQGGGGIGGGGGGGLFEGAGGGGGGQSNPAPRQPAPQPVIPPTAHVNLAGAGADRAAGADFVVQADPWQRQQSYIQAMRSVPKENAYGVYLQQRRAFGGSAAFYIDCADFLARFCDRAQAARVLTDAITILPDDPQLARLVARRLDRLGRYDLAIALFERLAKFDRDNPQSFRDLALALADSGDRAAADKNTASHTSALSSYKRALDLMRTVATRRWQRSPGIQLIAVTEYGDILRKARALDPTVHSTLDAPLGGMLEMDLRIVLTWDTQADLSLSMLEPTGEETGPGSTSTPIGGLLFTDCHDGYGPQEYCLRNKVPGRYVMRLHVRSMAEARTPTTVQAMIITDFGRVTEKRRVVSMMLNDGSDTVELGSLTIAR